MGESSEATARADRIITTKGTLLAGEPPLWYTSWQRTLGKTWWHRCNRPSHRRFPPVFPCFSELESQQVYPAPIVLILDDYQVIEESVIHQGMAFCVLLLLGTAKSGDAKGLNKGVLTTQAREGLVKRSGGNRDQYDSRIYRDSWCPREQFEGCRASAAQAQNYHFYRRVWFGEVLHGV